MKNNAGITLIALVISIIVMLILAGVSLNATVGDNGILTKAREAKITQEDATWYENAEMALTEAYMNEDVVDNIPEWIRQKFSEFSDDEVFVSEYMDGYLIVSGKRMITVDKNMQISSSKNNSYLVATGDDWYFLPNGTGTCKLTASKMSLTGTITIPSVVTDKETGNVYMVTELADDIFNYATRITKVDFSQAYNLTKIGARAFAFCSNLEINVPEDLPSTITSIGDKAFYGCTKLNGNINSIKDKGYTLGKGVFMKCPNISGSIQDVFNENFYIDESGNPVATVIEESQFSGYSGLTGALTIPAYITSIENNAFYGCTGITELNFEDTESTPSQCEKIGDSAFYLCNNVSNKLVLPNSIQTIGEYAFSQCARISGIKLPNNIQKIGYQSFSYGYSMNGELVIPKSLTEISTGAFRDCRFSSLTFQYDENNGTTTIGKYAFTYMPNLKNVTLPNTLKIIDNFAFEGDSALENIGFPNSLETIGANVFYGCVNMKVSNWSNKLKTIGGRSFEECRQLENLPNTDELVSIAYRAFYNCKKIGYNNGNGTDIIQWIKNSNKLTNIDQVAFCNDTYLKGNYTGSLTNKSGKTLTLGSGVFSQTNVTYSKYFSAINGLTKIPDDFFNGVTSILDDSGNEITNLVIPSNITSIGERAFAGTSIVNVTINKNVTSIGKEAFRICNKLKKVEFEDGIKISILETSLFDESSLESIVIPNTVTTISASVFHSCSNLKSITVPSSVTYMGSDAFGWSGLESITLNEGLKTVQGYVFQGCKGLKQITLPNSLEKLGDQMFFTCSALQTITIGDKVTAIPSNFALNATNLNTINLNGNITSIGSRAFEGCSNLKNMNKINWNNINSIGTTAFRNCSSLTGDAHLSNNCTLFEDSFDNCPLNVYKD